MPLIENADGSHVYVAPQNLNVLPDLQELMSPRTRLPITSPLGGCEFVTSDLGIDLGKEYAGAHYFRYTQAEGRGTFKQRGYIEDSYRDFSDTDMVFDKYEVGRHSFTTSMAAGVGFSLPSTGRLWGDEFLGKYLMACSQSGVAATLDLFQDTGAYEPTIAAVPGWTAPAGAVMPLYAKNISVQGAPTFWICYLTTAGNTIQVLTDLSNPPTTTSPAFTFPVWGLVPTPIDGEAVVMITTDAGGGRAKVINTNLGLGAATIYDRARIPTGGYPIGLVNMGPSAEVWIWAPNPDIALGQSNGLATPWIWRGKILRLDLRANVVSEVTTKLPFVHLATHGQGDVFYCDGTNHQYMTRGADIPVYPEGEDYRVENANIIRSCMSHWYDQGRFFWQEDFVDVTGVTTTTSVRFMYDTYLRRAFPIGKRVTLISTTFETMGSPRAPISSLNRHMISAAGTGLNPRWVYQYLNPSSRLGYNLRGTDNAATTSGRRYEASAYRRSPKLTSKQFPRADFLLGRILGPPRANLRTGSGQETGMTWADAYCTVDVTNVTRSGDVVFAGDAPYDGRGRWDNPTLESWTPFLETTVTSYRTTAGTNYERRTPNPWPITYEGIIVEDGMRRPSTGALREVFDRLSAA